MRWQTIILLSFILFFAGFAGLGHAEKDGFIYIISEEKLIEPHAHIVVGESFFIFHSYDFIGVKYYKGNETFYERKVYSKVLQLTLHDGATLEIKHGNETLLSCVTHKATFGNILKYKAGIAYQSSITSIILAFIAAIAVNVAYYYNLETRIL